MTDTALVAMLLRGADRGPAAEPAPVRLCRAAVAVVGAPGGWFTWDPADVLRQTIATTDAVAGTLDAVEEVLGVGPAGRAALDGQPTAVLVGAPTTGHAAGWLTLYAETAARRIGPAHLPLLVRAWPVRCGGLPVGALCVHGPRGAGVPTPRLADEPPDGQRVADALGEVLAVTPPGAPARSCVQRAVGMLVAQTGRSPADALAVLRARAWADGRTLGQVADDVVARRLRLDRVAPEPGDPGGPVP